LLSTDRYRSAGKDIDVLAKLQEVLAQLQPIGLEHVVIVGQLNRDRRPKEPLPTLKGVNVMEYPDLLDLSAQEILFWRGPSNAPLWVLYSSGTSMSKTIHKTSM